ncbi:glycosyltransferase family 2 protein [Kaistella palustris]|uniref:glycosyltransferase family 2 protein n=1 Tax=Kaistella palustris TaxID=493376 RepID=UPI0003FBCAEF|nr:glycosyltransferase family 2 protein [Kaistella palustris]
MTVCIIIVTYNAMKWAEKCFSSLRNSSVGVHTIVIDNGSTDGTQEFIAKNFPEVELQQSTKNLGFGKANNIGLEKAWKKGADFFYLMNQDAWIYDDTIRELLEVYEKHPEKGEMGILSPMHLDGSEQRLDIFLDKYIAQNFENRYISDLYLRSVQDLYQMKFINAAHWFLPRKTVETVGGFNPYFFHYGEDQEYVNRLHFHGKKILLCPKSRAVHDGKQNLAKVDYAKYCELSVETNILNPNLPNAYNLEKKALVESIAKNLMLGNVKKATELFKKSRKVTSEKKVLLDLRKKVEMPGPTFLNI